MKITKGDILKVVDGGFCVGCGACAFSSNTDMTLNEFGEYVPNLNEIESLPQKSYQQSGSVCPSLNESQNENALANHFLDSSDPHSEYIGRHKNIYGGYVSEGDYRANGTSGGFGTWIGASMFKEKLIDGVIHVKDVTRNSAKDPFFEYGLSTSLDEIHMGAKTKYHVVEMSGILRLLKDSPGRYLFIGVPCMVKAIRRLQLNDPALRESIKYTASLVCGHLKSVNWTLSLGWAKGVHPEQAMKFKYRTKGPAISARAYVFTAYTDSREIVEDSAKVAGGKFNQGALMLEACNFCDDVVGETADITIGDAWLPQFEVDSQGTNMLIVRNKEIDDLIKRHSAMGTIATIKLTEADVKDAQAGGFRQRREGLSYRLHRKDIENEWRPIKRIQANSMKVPLLRRTIYYLRQRVTHISRQSFKEALDSDDYLIYRKRILIRLKMLRMLEILGSLPRIARKKIATMRVKRTHDEPTV